MRSRNGTGRPAFGALAAAFGVVLAVGAQHPQAHTKATQVTWSVDVAPIVSARCAGCHQDGGYGPMSLASYAAAKPWAKAIRDQVLSGRMPPWSAVPGFGDFGNDASLSGVELELIARWAEGGAPPGPEVPARTETARPSGRRSVAVRLELPPVRVAGRSIQSYELATSFAGDRWITGWNFEPGNRALVEEAIVSIGGTPIGGWTPLGGPVAYPHGVGERLPKASPLTVEVHYRRSAEPHADRNALTLDVESRPLRALLHRIVECGTHPIDDDIDVVAVKPRPAAAGDSMEIVAHGPHAEIDPLCVVSRFKPEYPVTYQLRAQLRLARRTRLDVRASSNACVATIDYVKR
jgi:mono/diheme cytochrome c family protein